MIEAVILAAGEGKRMKSEIPKVLYPLCGKLILAYILDTLLRIDKINEIIVVVQREDDKVAEFVSENYKNVKIVTQGVPRGTADALRVALESGVNEKGDVLVLHGDTPLIPINTIESLIDVHADARNDLTFVAAEFSDPQGYGRILRTDKSIKIIEDREIKDKEKAKINLVNVGIYIFSIEAVRKILPLIDKNNVQQEYYLTDAIELMQKNNYKVDYICKGDDYKLKGVNSPSQLVELQKNWQKEIIQNHLKNGVLITDPNNIYIDVTVEIEPGVIIYPFSFLYGKSVIKAAARIGPFSYISDSFVGEGAQIIAAFINASKIKEKAKVGPYANLRFAVELEEGVKVGNFVELKAAHLKEGAKAPHLSYIGDAEIGKKTNVGAGTITCNYDGYGKNKTIIGDEVLIGSNTALIAPIQIGNNVVIAAGSVLTSSVPANSLAIARCKQKNIKEGANKYHAKKRAKYNIKD
jgi:bifunctional UDP-N-acetylglucosamine pyrophosphorylase/glucosamine-1-phosphate N-acetyltransferase